MSQIFHSQNSGPQAWTLSHLPATISALSLFFCLQFALLPMVKLPHLLSHSQNFFPSYSLYIWTFPAFPTILSLRPQSVKVAPKWRGGGMAGGRGSCLAKHPLLLHVFNPSLPKSKASFPCAVFPFSAVFLFLSHSFWICILLSLHPLLSNSHQSSR